MMSARVMLAPLVAVLGGVSVPLRYDPTPDIIDGVADMVAAGGRPKPGGKRQTPRAFASGQILANLETPFQDYIS